MLKKTVPLAVHFQKLIHKTSYRYELARCVISGKKVILNELPSHVKVNSILAVIPEQKKYPFSMQDVREAVQIKFDRVPVEVIHSRLAKELLGLDSAPTKIDSISGTWVPLVELICEIDMPQLKIHSSPRRLLIIDQVRDPGNLGSLLRTAQALNWDAVLTIKGTVDVWNQKVVRASRGAVLRMPTKQMDDVQDAVRFASSLGLQTIIADSKSRPQCLQWNGLEISRSGSVNGSWHVPSKIALVLSSESDGVSEQLNDGENMFVRIPMHQADSINVAVAGGILMSTLGAAR